MSAQPDLIRDCETSTELLGDANGLPEGWAEVGFMNLFDIQGGTQPPKSDFIYQPKDGYLRLLQIRDFGEKPVPTYIRHTTKLKTCLKDDILIGRYGASVGRICTGMEGAYNVALAKVLIPEAIDRRFVSCLLSSKAFQEPLLKVERSAQDGFNKEDLAEIHLPLPPFAEQRRIVSKLELLLGKVSSSQQRLARVPGLLKRFRQSVLAAACSGKLTADWREENPDVEHSAQLLDRIDKRRLIVAAKVKSGNATNVTREHVVRLRKEESPEDIIPDSWSWVRFGSVIGELRNGISIRPNVDPPGTPILRISAARPGSVDLTDFRFLEDSVGYLPLYTLKNNDLLFTRYNGSLELLGVCGMVRSIGKTPVLYPDKLMRVRFDHDFIEPGYAEIFFQVADVHERIIAKSKSSAGQNGVSGTDIKNQPFAVPPLSEQQEIVRRVEKLFGFADQIEAGLKRAQTHVDRLTQSLLAKAFQGKLVPTEAELACREGRDYEPASALLERIKTEQATTNSEPKKKAKRTKN